MVQVLMLWYQGCRQVAEVAMRWRVRGQGVEGMAAQLRAVVAEPRTTVAEAAPAMRLLLQLQADGASPAASPDPVRLYLDTQARYRCSQPAAGRPQSLAVLMPAAGPVIVTMHITYSKSEPWCPRMFPRMSRMLELASLPIQSCRVAEC